MASPYAPTTTTKGVGDNCELLPIVTDPFDPLICYVYLQLLLIGIDLVIQAPKSPEFSYTVFYGIA